MLVFVPPSDADGVPRREDIRHLDLSDPHTAHFQEKLLLLDQTTTEILETDDLGNDILKAKALEAFAFAKTTHKTFVDYEEQCWEAAIARFELRRDLDASVTQYSSGMFMTVEDSGLDSDPSAQNTTTGPTTFMPAPSTSHAFSLFSPCISCLVSLRRERT